MDATPTINNIPFRSADFSTLSEALDYAGQGKTGFNFYAGNGKIIAALPYSELREQAQALARRLMGLGLNRGSRVALVADTHPDFLRFFFACQYAGLVPVPFPASIQLGGHKSYVSNLQRLLAICQAEVAMAPDDFLSFLTKAAEGLNLRFVGNPKSFYELPEPKIQLQSLQSEEMALLQYTSGSTRFPRGVMITQKAVLSDIVGMVKYGFRVRPDDRAVSWLPYYHDMGLVGFVLAPIASQTSVDYLRTRDFALRPRQWLYLMSKNRATLSVSPPFGYQLCASRLRKKEVQNLDLSTWRIAGVGAETIRPEPLEYFAELLEPAGFDKRSFLPCYGMAECSLAVSFTPVGRGIILDNVDSNQLAEHRRAVPVDDGKDNGFVRSNTFVNCGIPLPGYEVEVRNRQGHALPERRCGTLYVRGPSVMSGYFGDLKATREVLSPDGWLNTGDLAYLIGESIVVTGRQKDLLIINGRNIWPQDLEYIAEQQPEVRTGDVSVFSVAGSDGAERAVMMIQCRESKGQKQTDLKKRLHGLVSREFGIDCLIELIPRNTLPRTTSGKLSRAGARKEYLNRMAAKPVRELGKIYTTIIPFDQP